MRVIFVECDLSCNTHIVSLRLDTIELEACIGYISFHALQVFQKVSMPEASSEFSIGDRLESHFNLLVDHIPDFFGLYLTELFIGNPVRLIVLPCLMYAFGPQ